MLSFKVSPPPQFNQSWKQRQFVYFVCLGIKKTKQNKQTNKQKRQPMKIFSSKQNVFYKATQCPFKPGGLIQLNQSLDNFLF